MKNRLLQTSKTFTSNPFVNQASAISFVPLPVDPCAKLCTLIELKEIASRVVFAWLAAFCGFHGLARWELQAALLQLPDMSYRK